MIKKIELTQFILHSLTLLVSIGVFNLTYAQEIRCIDTISTKAYFFRVRFKNKTGHSSMIKLKNFACYVSDSTKSIDDIYYNGRGYFNDTVKYLTYIPEIDKFLQKKFDRESCINLLKNSLLIDSLLVPQNYYPIRRRNKEYYQPEIGFSEVNAKWLHLKIVDRIAFDYFNSPYSLTDPFYKAKYFDIYIPLKIIQIKNNVTIINKRISNSR